MSEHALRYGDHRWRVICDQYDGMRKFALDELLGALQEYVRYTPVCLAGYEAVDEPISSIIVGTADFAPLSSLAASGFYVPESAPQGYSIRVAAHPTQESQMLAVIQGADEAGVLYGVMDFLHWYVQNAARYDGYIYNGRKKLFIDEMPEFEKKSAPITPNRGLWTWGHVIGDYRGYIDNMARWKMNTLIIWNDHAPLNAADVVAYAHARGVRIVWGYSWCWGEKVDPNSAEELAYWKKRVVEVYEREYAPLGGDGVYFQTFTETSEQEKGGRPIAELAVEWVNEMSAALFERHPGLWLQFGLHAISITERAEVMARIDPRVTIVWEDAGGFPYAYDPRRQEEASATRAYNRRLLALRGAEERFGAVFKGFALIDWAHEFENQQGPFIMGTWPASKLTAWADEKKFFFDFARAYWFEHAEKFRDVVRDCAAAGIAECTLTALVEDSAWEVHQWAAVCLFAELLWDGESSTEVIRKIIAQNPEVV